MSFRTLTGMVRWFAVLALVAMAAACSGGGNAPAGGAPAGGAGSAGAGARGAAGAGGGGGRRGAGPAVDVRVTNVKRMSIQRMVDLAGNLNSPDLAKVSSEAAGVVREVLVEIGTEVRAGQPLIKLDPRELEYAAVQAESTLRQTYAQLGMHENVKGDTPPPLDEQVATVKTAVANLEDAKASMARADALNKKGVLSAVDLQAAQTKLKVAEASYQAAFDTVRSLKAQLAQRRAAYELAQKKLADTTVKAPIAGGVVDRYVQIGEYISERTAVATIVQTNPLKLRTGVQERHAGVVQAGQHVEFRVASFGDTLFNGKVAYVSPAVDQAMRTFQVEALVENNDHRLKPGFFAKGVIFTKKDEGVLAVPDTAVSTLAGVSSVYVIKNGRVTQQQVTLGVRQGDLWEVVEGLNGDETVANNRLNELATGVTVRVGSGEEGSRGGRGGRQGAAGAQGGPGARGAQGGGQGGEGVQSAPPAGEAQPGAQQGQGGTRQGGTRQGGERQGGSRRGGDGQAGRQGQGGAQ
jgi:RND family efflux transporter MFP subunit